MTCDGCQRGLLLINGIHYVGLMPDRECESEDFMELTEFDVEDYLDFEDGDVFNHCSPHLTIIDLE